MKKIILIIIGIILSLGLWVTAFAPFWVWLSNGLNLEGGIDGSCTSFALSFIGSTLSFCISTIILIDEEEGIYAY